MLVILYGGTVVSSATSQGNVQSLEWLRTFVDLVRFSYEFLSGALVSSRCPKSPTIG